MKSPVQLRQKICLKIEAYSEGKDFVSHVEGFPIYVPNALPGEEVEVKILEVKRNYARGQILEIMSAHPARVQPPCEYFYKCGGCHWQHMDYAFQLEIKKKLIEQGIRSYENLRDVRVEEVKGAGHFYHYRGKAQQPVVPTGTGAATGFFFPGTHRLTPVDRCEVQTKLQDLIIRFVMRWVHIENIPAYDEKKHEGFLRHLVVRESLALKEAMLIFVTYGDEGESLKPLAEAVVKKFPQVVSVIQNINRQKTNVILGDENKVLKGQGFIFEKVLGLRFRISPGSFFQIHTEQIEKVVETVRQYAALAGGETVIDAYCGVGLLSMSLADRAGQVYGIESNVSALEDAYASAQMNHTDSMEFLAMPAHEGLKSLQAQGVDADVVILDPPRQGCDEETLKTLRSFSPRKIIYVSCNPDTLARDLAYLDLNGYRVKGVTPVDLFPQTHHVESVAFLEKKDTEGRGE